MKERVILFALGTVIKRIRKTKTQTCNLEYSRTSMAQTQMAHSPGLGPSIYCLLKKIYLEYQAYTKSI